MSKDELMMRILTAPPATLAKIAGVLDGRTPDAGPSDRRLLTFSDAARQLNVSRMTVHRMVDDGRLPVVETRLGRRRVASQAITDFLGLAGAHRMAGTTGEASSLSTPIASRGGARA